MNKNRLEKIVEPLLQWYEGNKRKLPWRDSGNPYYIWISEIMLQQTRVEAVKGYYSKFIERLPDVKALAEVDDDELMKLWQGLGYYNRARNLKKAAKQIMERYHGEFPKEYEELLPLAGIGEYTAGAIASMAFEKNVPAIDGNVYRIYTRVCADGEDITKRIWQKQMREEILKILPKGRSGDFNQALMDLGAMVCIPNGEPLCESCPLQDLCQAKENGNIADYPNKPRKKERRIEEKTVIILECQGKYLLQQRATKGLLAGLWEFPSEEGCLSQKDLIERLKTQGIEMEELELLGTAKHIFSHIEWHMFGYLVHMASVPKELSETLHLVSVDEIKKQYSIPSAYAVYLNRIMQE